MTVFMLLALFAGAVISAGVLVVAMISSQISREEEQAATDAAMQIVREINLRVPRPGE